MLCLGGGNDEEEVVDEYDAIPFGLRWRMRWGKHEKHPNTNEEIIRLSTNRLVQTHCANTEYQALKLVDRHTSVPTYKVIGIYNRPEGKLVEYETLPGKPLDTVWSSLPQDKKTKIVADVGRFVEQLRKMEPPKHCVIGDATLGAAHDERFGRGGEIGPFYSIDAFHEFIRRGHSIEEFDDQESKEIRECHSRPQPYVLKFTHARICPRNILVDEVGRVSALIGWESSGWYPEYWEYTQMYHATSAEFDEDWLDMLRKVVPRYDKELKADDVLRLRYNSAIYDRPRSVRPPSPSDSELRREQQEIDDKNTESTSG